MMITHRDSYLCLSADGKKIVTTSGFQPPLDFYGSISADLLPSANNAYDLGSSSLRWQDIYTVNLDVQGTITGNYLDVIPYADSTYVLGNATRQWKSLALDDGNGNVSIWPSLTPFTSGQGNVYITGNTNNYASASADGQTLVGYGGQVGYAESTALGYFALGTAPKAVALGAGTTASADSALAAGYGASATAASSIAIGPAVTNSAANTILLGKAGVHTRFTSAGDHYPTSNNAFDLGAVATKWRVLYTGDVQTSTLTATSATITGTLTAGTFSGPATSLNDLVLQGNTTQTATAAGTNAIAMGKSSSAAGNYAIAQGWSSLAPYDYSVVIGYNAGAGAAKAVVIGANADGVGSGVTIGADSTVQGGGTGVECVCIGNNTGIVGDDNVLIGRSSGIGNGGGGGIRNQSVVVGAAASAMGNNAVAVGYGTSAGGTGTICLGSGTSCAVDYALALPSAQLTAATAGAAGNFLVVYIGATKYKLQLYADS